MRRSTAGFALLCLVLLAVLACRRSEGRLASTGAPPAPAIAVGPRGERAIPDYCWWATLRTGHSPDSVAARFVRGFAHIGIPGATVRTGADTSIYDDKERRWEAVARFALAHAGPARLTAVGGDVPDTMQYEGWAVAWVRQDTTRVRYYLAQRPRLMNRDGFNDMLPRCQALWRMAMMQDSPQELRAARADSVAGAASGLLPAARDSVIDRLLHVLDSAYVFPERASAMRTAILLRRTAGRYERLMPDTLATELTRDLRAVSRDQHLQVWHTGGMQEFDFSAQPGRLDARAAPCTPRRWVCPAKMLPGNVGYLELRAFGALRSADEADLATAMNTVADADALIIDLRRNQGGRPEGVALMSSYLLGTEPQLLGMGYWRADNRTDSLFSRREVAGKRYDMTKPVYVLTSRRTFSAAEGFAYGLQSRRRAKIVGDTTGGGAHMGGRVRLGHEFVAWIPSGRAIDAVTGANWEGTGVVPDIVVPADSALTAALAAARRRR